MVAELWKIYSDQVFHYLNKRINDGDVAGDLLQDTFYKVLVHKEDLDKVENHKAWLFSIARNTLIDFTRKKREQSIEDFTDVKANEGSDVGQNIADDIAECLYELINEYDGKEREVLLEIFTKSLSQKEASQYLDVPYSTLKSRIRKVRREIMQEFNDRCCRLQYNHHGEIIGCVPVSTGAPANC